MYVFHHSLDFAAPVALFRRILFASLVAPRRWLLRGGALVTPSVRAPPPPPQPLPLARSRRQATPPPRWLSAALRRARRWRWPLAQKE
jgi:hypothetical protein